MEFGRTVGETGPSGFSVVYFDFNVDPGRQFSSQSYFYACWSRNFSLTYLSESIQWITKQHTHWNICIPVNVIIIKMLLSNMMLMANLVRNAWVTRKKMFWSFSSEVRPQFTLDQNPTHFQALQMWNGAIKIQKHAFSHWETDMQATSEGLKKSMTI